MLKYIAFILNNNNKKRALKMILKPLIKNFLIYQGTTFMASFEWNIDKYPLDANCIVDMQIRPDIKSDVVICEASTTNNKIFIHPAEKIIEIKIPATETAGFKFEKAVYDIELEFPNGDKFRIVQGQMTLSLEVTRSE